MRLEEANHQNAQSQLFSGWRHVRLGDVCSVHPGQHILEADYNRKKLGIGYLTGPADFGITYPTVTKWTENPKAWCEPGDVLVTVKGAGVGKINLAPTERVAIGRQLMAIRPTLGQITQEFLYQIMTTHFSHLQGSALGATVPGLAREQIESLTIPFLALPEQKRIAAILNEQMAAVEQARAAAEAQLKAAKELPAAYLRQVFSSPEAQRWPRKRLGDILKLRKEVVHPRDNPTGAAIFVGLEHIQSVIGERIGSVNVDMAQLTGRKPCFSKGDIVYGYLRPYLNKVWIAEFGGLCSVDQYVYRVAKDFVDAEFVAWFMRSPTYLERAPIDTTPGQLPRIRTEEVASVELNIPSLREQQRIRVILNERMTRVTQLSKTLEQQLVSLDALPPTLLRQAFNGEL